MSMSMEMSLERPLIVTGFMGAGKSKVGQMLASEFGAPFYDNDTEVLNAKGISPANLIRERGVDAFREIEVDVLATILERPVGVIATGGGIVSTQFGRGFLRASRADIVWLDVPFEVARGRVMQDEVNDRPLFRDVDEARKLYDERQPWYRQTAGFVVNAAQDSRSVVKDIKRVLWIAE